MDTPLRPSGAKFVSTMDRKGMQKKISFLSATHLNLSRVCLGMAFDFLQDISLYSSGTDGGVPWWLTNSSNDMQPSSPDAEAIPTPYCLRHFCSPQTTIRGCQKMMMMIESTLSTSLPSLNMHRDRKQLPLFARISTLPCSYLYLLSMLGAGTTRVEFVSFLPALN